MIPFEILSCQLQAISFHFMPVQPLKNLMCPLEKVFIICHLKFMKSKKG